MNRETMRSKILELVPRDRSVLASDVVATLSIFPVAAVWSQIVILVMEGVVGADNPGRYDGNAMLRRLA
jgi:hypothetical protein